MESKVVYNGKEYTKYGNKWVDSRCCVAPDSVQRELNNQLFSEIDLDSLSANELVSAGDSYKESNTHNLAIKCYEKALEKCNDRTVRYILPKLTSCLRKQGKATEVILIFTKMKAKWGNKMLSPAALTSIAAAYCDISEYDKAKKCCNRAYAMSQGNSSGELKAVYGRIKKESELLK